MLHRQCIAFVSKLGIDSIPKTTLDDMPSQMGHAESDLPVRRATIVSVCVRAFQLHIARQNELSFRISEKRWTLNADYCFKVSLVPYINKESYLDGILQ